MDVTQLVFNRKDRSRLADRFNIPRGATSYTCPRPGTFSSSVMILIARWKETIFAAVLRFLVGCDLSVVGCTASISLEEKDGHTDAIKMI